MNDKDHERGRRGLVRGIVLLVVVVAAIAFSAGPAWWFVHKRRSNELLHTYQTVYAPVWWALGKPVWYLEYVEWWEPK
jgi:hypothetical protein